VCDGVIAKIREGCAMVSLPKLGKGVVLSPNLVKGVRWCN
jgi:hypothetical protein